MAGDDQLLPGTGIAFEWDGRNILTAKAGDRVLTREEAEAAAIELIREEVVPPLTEAFRDLDQEAIDRRLADLHAGEPVGWHNPLDAVDGGHGER